MDPDLYDIPEWDLVRICMVLLIGVGSRGNTYELASGPNNYVMLLLYTALVCL